MSRPPSREAREDLAAARRMVEEVFPLYRHNCSPGLDESLRIVRTYVPDLEIETYETGTPVWTWSVPPKWRLQRAWIRDDRGRTIADSADQPLHVWTCSRAIDAILTWDQLRPHLHSDPERPDLIPWKFNFYGEPTWGFSLEHDRLQSLDPARIYPVHIDSDQYADRLSFGAAFLPGRSGRVFLIASNLCHPVQANDSLTGAAAAYVLYRRLRERPRWFSYLFTFGPEIIGTIAYFAHHENLIPDIDYGIFSEMLGRDSPLVLQHSFQRHTYLDALASQVMLERLGDQGVSRLYLLEDGPTNDELILCAPGLQIPTVAFNRGYFREYHSHRDDLSLVDWDRVGEAVEILWEIVARMERSRHRAAPTERTSRLKAYARFRLPVLPHDDVVPLPQYKGHVFLSPHGLYVDWRTDFKLSSAVGYLMTAMNGTRSCYDLSEETGLPYGVVRDYVEKFRERGFVKMLPVRYVEDLGMVHWTPRETGLVAH